MQKSLKTVFLILAAVAGVVFHLVAWDRCVPEYHRWKERRETRAQLQKETEAIRQEIVETNRNIERFQVSRDFVERLARENQRVAENEIVFVLD